MANVVDGATNWPCHSVRISDTNITVTMAGNNGLNAVCAGAARPGSVQNDDGNAYAVRLPGSFQGGTLDVTFRRT
jgi:hypothetical protein